VRGLWGGLTLQADGEGEDLGGHLHAEGGEDEGGCDAVVRVPRVQEALRLTTYVGGDSQGDQGPYVGAHRQEHVEGEHVRVCVPLTALRGRLVRMVPGHGTALSGIDLLR